MDIESEQPATRYLFKKPRPLQWSEHGQFIRRPDGPKVSPFELFLDLVYVAVVANFAEHLTTNLSAHELIKYILILPPSWNIWAALTEFLNLWSNDDISQRIYVFCNTAILMVYGNNAPLIDKDIFYLRLCVYLYLAVHANITIITLLYSLSSHRYRAQLRLWAILIAIASSFWAPLLSDKISIRTKVALAVAGLIFEEVAWAFSTSPLAARILHVEDEPAVYSSHEQERYTSIYIIGLGQFTFRLIMGSPVAGINFRTLLALWTLIIAFNLNWMYVNGDGALHPRHPLNHNFPVIMQWMLLHNPLLASLLAGGQVAVEGSTELTEGRKLGRPSHHGDKFTVAHSWLLCGSLCMSIYILYLFAQLAGSKGPSGKLVLPKQMRLIMRPIIGLVIIMLPLAHDRLGFSLTLSIIMGLVVFCVMWESLTSLQHDMRIWKPWTAT